MTDYERAYVEQGYRLPDHYDWEMVHAARKQYEIERTYVPLACGPNVVGWGIPFKDGKPMSAVNYGTCSVCRREQYGRRHEHPCE